MPGSKPSDVVFFLAGHGVAQAPAILVAKEFAAAEEPAPTAGLSPLIVVDACSGEEAVSAPVTPPSPAEQLASSIVALVGSHQAGRRSNGHNPREVMDALARATSQLLAGYAQSFPAGTDFVQEFVKTLQQQASGSAPTGTPIPRNKTH